MPENYEIQNKEFIPEFVEEAKIHVENAESRLLKMDETSVNSEDINNIFRAVHSIKGTAVFFGLKNIVDLAHDMETVFGEIRSGKLSLSNNMTDVLLCALDCLRSMILDVYNSMNVDISEYRQSLKAILERRLTEKPSKEIEAPTTTPTPEVEPTSFAVTALEENYAQLQEALKHGHKSYLVEFIADNTYLNIDDFIKKIESVGKVIKCEPNGNHLLITSVLEKKLLAMALKINESKISQCDIKPIPSETVVATIASVDTLEENHTEAAFTPKELLQKALKDGHKLYLVYFIIDDARKNSVTPYEFIKKIESIGNIIESDLDINLVKQLEDSESSKGFLQSGEYLTFIITSDREKELLAIELNINEPKIQQLDSNTKYKQLKNILKERSLSAYPVTKRTDLTTIERDTQANTAKKTEVVKIEDSVRVKVSLLDDLLDLASEQVLGINQLVRSLKPFMKQLVEIDPSLQHVKHNTALLQEKILRTRMLPTTNVFQRFPLMIRDMSKKLEKDVYLIVGGTQVELDKSIIEILGDPIAQLIRNAIDHGLESPDVREKLGKSPKGIIELKAYQKGGYVNIDVIDDGAGINIENIKKKALEKGLINLSDVDKMTEQDIIKFIFKPGFSTARTVTDVSGRGVGLDVVKTNIEKLGGSVEVYTTLGKGSIFRLILPITLAIIKSQIVEVKGQKFAIPQIKLQEVVSIRQSDTSKRLEYIHNSEVLRLRNELLPIVHLSHVLGLEPKETLELDEKWQHITRVLVLKTGQKKFGLIVDKILDDYDSLVKPLPKYLKDCDCYSNVTILDDGKPAMILDPDGIVEKVNLRFPEELALEPENNPETTSNAPNNEQELLLFNCSGTEVFAIDINLISRIEKIPVSEIETIGDREYIKFRGAPLRIVRLENYLPVTSKKNESKFVHVIVPRYVKYPIGILAEKIIDTVNEEIKLNTESIQAHGLIGTAILQNRVVLLVNIYEIFEKAAPEHYAPKNAIKAQSNSTILLVEDTPLFARLEKDYLEEAGYTVLLATNGKEALDILKHNAVKLIISDIQMPVMDGFELVKQIREDKRLCHLPMIAITSLTGESNMKEVLDADFDFYEPKLDRASLLNKVEVALKGRNVV